MATRNPGIKRTITGLKKTLKALQSKVEVLEDQCFAQHLAIGELENKLQQAESLIQQVRENPFGMLPVAIPPAQPYVSYPYPPLSHVCAGVPDGMGNMYCSTCGAYMLTYTSNNLAQSSTNVEDNVDITWYADDGTKIP